MSDAPPQNFNFEVVGKRFSAVEQHDLTLTAMSPKVQGEWDDPIIFLSHQLTPTEGWNAPMHGAARKKFLLGEDQIKLSELPDYMRNMFYLSTEFKPKKIVCFGLGLGIMQRLYTQLGSQVLTYEFDLDLVKLVAEHFPANLGEIHIVNAFSPSLEIEAADLYVIDLYADLSFPHDMEVENLNGLVKKLHSTFPNTPVTMNLYPSKTKYDHLDWPYHAVIEDRDNKVMLFRPGAEPEPLVMHAPPVPAEAADDE